LNVPVNCVISLSYCQRDGRTLGKSTCPFPSRYFRRVAFPSYCLDFPPVRSNDATDVGHATIVKFQRPVFAASAWSSFFFARRVFYSSARSSRTFLVSFPLENLSMFLVPRLFFLWITAPDRRVDVASRENVSAFRPCLRPPYSGCYSPLPP